MSAMCATTDSFYVKFLPVREMLYWYTAKTLISVSLLSVTALLSTKIEITANGTF